jgi:hypothetical protein
VPSLPKWTITTAFLVDGDSRRLSVRPAGELLQSCQRISDDRCGQGIIAVLDHDSLALLGGDEPEKFVYELLERYGGLLMHIDI